MLMLKIPLPIILLTILCLSWILSPIMPLFMKQCFFTFSFYLKDLLIFLLPIIIFGSVYIALNKVKTSKKFLILVIFIVVLSNSFSVFLTAIFNYLIFEDNHTKFELYNYVSSHEKLEIFNFGKLPKLISNEFALFVSIGFAIAPKQFLCVQKIANQAYKFSNWFLSYFFIPLLPLFIFGFMLKILSDNIFYKMEQFNIGICFLMIMYLIFYLAILIVMSIKISTQTITNIISNILPPLLVAFSSMSSAAALPLSIQAAHKNTNDEKLADLIMPLTVNIHMIGGAICIPIMTIIIMDMFHFPMPTITQYAIFGGMFVLTRFSGAAVPGGSILVTLPILEKYLGFTSEMLASITAFYMIMDPITTSGNVVGNNIFVIYMKKIQMFLGGKNHTKK